jgi:hypothetical protein
MPLVTRDSQLRDSSSVQPPSTMCTLLTCCEAYSGAHHTHERTQGGGRGTADDAECGAGIMSKSRTGVADYSGVTGNTVQSGSPTWRSPEPSKGPALLTGTLPSGSNSRDMEAYDVEESAGIDVDAVDAAALRVIERRTTDGRVR